MFKVEPQEGGKFGFQDGAIRYVHEVSWHRHEDSNEEEHELYDVKADKI